MVSAAADGAAAEKKSLHAEERDTAEAHRRRQEWREEVSRLDPQQLVFLDESGATTEMTRRYGRALRGERVGEAAPQGHWQTVTMLAALTPRGLEAPMTIPAPTDGDIFLAYLEQVLCPCLRSGQVVILDNLAAHKVDGVQALVEKTGARLLYLPPYSPDFNPIEQAWSKSSRFFARPKHALWKLWNRLSLKLWRPSLQTMPLPGLVTADSVYSKCENALDCSARPATRHQLQSPGGHSGSSSVTTRRQGWLSSSINSAE